MTDTMGIFIPFSGFYESIHYESMMFKLENMAECGNGLPHDIEELDELINWPATFQEVAEQYANEWLGRLPLTGAKFSRLWSPREYNFAKNQIYLEVPVEPPNKVRECMLKCAPDGFYDWVKEKYASHSGFHSFVEDTDQWRNDWQLEHYSLMFEYIEEEVCAEREEEIIESLIGNGGYELVMGEAL